MISTIGRVTTDIGNDELCKNGCEQRSYNSFYMPELGKLYDAQYCEYGYGNIHQAIAVFKAYDIRESVYTRVYVGLHITNIEGDTEGEYEYKT